MSVWERARRQSLEGGGPLKKTNLQGDWTEVLPVTFKAVQSDFVFATSKGRQLQLEASCWCEGAALPVRQRPTMVGGV